MFFKLVAAFTLIPVLELYVIIKLGGVLGAFNTIFVVIVTAVAGAHLARVQGIQTMLRVRARLNAGEAPTDDLVDAVIIFMAGVVLLTPGFITDAVGILLLIPATRAVFKRWLQKKFEAMSRSGEIRIQRF
jgi:UPF0716 protein FxsA